MSRYIAIGSFQASCKNSQKTWFRRYGKKCGRRDSSYCWHYVTEFSWRLRTIIHGSRWRIRNGRRLLMFFKAHYSLRVYSCPAFMFDKMYIIQYLEGMVSSFLVLSEEWVSLTLVFDDWFDSRSTNCILNLSRLYSSSWKDYVHLAQWQFASKGFWKLRAFSSQRLFWRNFWWKLMTVTRFAWFDVRISASILKVLNDTAGMHPFLSRSE